MNIVSVRTHILRHHLVGGEAFAYSQASYTARAAMLVEVEAEDGTVGWGEAFGPPEVTSACVAAVYAPRLLGRDARQIGPIWDDLYNALRDHGQKGIPIEALSAIDIALWDLRGKHLGEPAGVLLGGRRRERVRAYATGLYRPWSAGGGVLRGPNAWRRLADEAASYVRQGFTAVKLKCGFGVEDDLAALAAVRHAVDEAAIERSVASRAAGAEPPPEFPAIRLMVDANHAYDARDAIRLGERLAHYGVYWYEEPVPPEDLAGYLEVKRALAHTGVAVAGGEAEFTRYGFRDLLSHRAVDIAQPDCAACGGLSEARAIALLADTFGVRCLPHVWGSAVAVAAALQFASWLPDTPPALCAPGPLLELDRTPNALREDLAVSPVTQIDGAGFLPVPAGPGLGVEIRRDVLERHREGGQEVRL